jgi:hypothetical protein
MRALRAFGTGCRVSLGEQRFAVDARNHLALQLHVGIGSNHLEIEDPGAGARLASAASSRQASRCGARCVLADSFSG